MQKWLRHFRCPGRMSIGVRLATNPHPISGGARASHSERGQYLADCGRRVGASWRPAFSDAYISLFGVGGSRTTQAIKGESVQLSVYRQGTQGAEVSHCETAMARGTAAYGWAALKRAAPSPSARSVDRMRMYGLEGSHPGGVVCERPRLQ